MKITTYLFTLTLATFMLIFSSCGKNKIALDDAITKGNMYVKKGMSKEKVFEIIKLEPSVIERIGDYELWIYEGTFPNENSKGRKYKNLVIKFKDGKVIYTAYFNCKLPKLEE